jgi:lipopolysaccharide/colanic/teichoic acid biosynthesis glycosyltransferase
MIRLFDIILSSVALILFSPLLLPIIALLRLTGEGEVFFRQDRIGLNGINFSLFKFATMLKDSPNIGNGTITLLNDPRVLPVGSFLRKTKINELPQLYNVFRGDMSLIGPRPQARRSFNAFSNSAQKAITLVKPGLSGIGSIIFRNEENMMHLAHDPNKFYDESIMPYKGELEKWFVENRNVKTYFALIFLTLWVLFFRNSNLVWFFFSTLPQPPTSLRSVIGLKK